MRTVVAAGLLVALVACSGSEEAPTAPEPDETAAPAPEASATPEPALTAIPAAFLGTWDYVEGKCLSYSDALMTVMPGEIRFYESHGMVTSITQDTPDSVTVGMDMAGEGEEWTESLVLTLVDGGQGLTTQVAGNPDGHEPFRHKRCAEVIDDLPEK